MIGCKKLLILMVFVSVIFCVKNMTGFPITLFVDEKKTMEANPKEVSCINLEEGYHTFRVEGELGSISRNDSIDRNTMWEISVEE